MHVRMATSPTIPVRIPPDMLRALDAWAKSIGQSRNAAIKLCLAKQLGLIEKADAIALDILDGRHYRASSPDEAVRKRTKAALVHNGTFNGPTAIGPKSKATQTIKTPASKSGSKSNS